MSLQSIVAAPLGGIIPSINAMLARYMQSGEEGEGYGLDNSVNLAARSLARLLGPGVAPWLGLRATYAAAALLFIIAALVAVWRMPEPKASAVPVVPEAG